MHKVRQSHMCPYIFTHDRCYRPFLGSSVVTGHLPAVGPVRGRLGGTLRVHAPVPQKAPAVTRSLSSDAHSCSEHRCWCARRESSPLGRKGEDGNEDRDVEHFYFLTSGGLCVAVDTLSVLGK